MNPLEEEIMSLKNGWFRVQFNAVNNIYGDQRSTSFTVKHCTVCNKAWEWLAQPKKTVYYSRRDLSFYKLAKVICRECK